MKEWLCERPAWRGPLIHSMPLCGYSHLHEKSSATFSFSLPTGKCKPALSSLKYGQLWDCPHLYPSSSRSEPAPRYQGCHHWNLVPSPGGRGFFSLPAHKRSSLSCCFRFYSASCRFDANPVKLPVCAGSFSSCGAALLFLLFPARERWEPPPAAAWAGCRAPNAPCLLASILCRAGITPREENCTKKKKGGLTFLLHFSTCKLKTSNQTKPNPQNPSPRALYLHGRGLWGLMQLWGFNKWCF